MYSFYVFINLIIISLTTSLNLNPSIPLKIGNWSVDCEELNSGPSIVISGSLRFQYGLSSEQFVDMPSSDKLVNVSSICDDDQQFMELHWVVGNSSGIKDQKVWLGLKFTKLQNLQGIQNDTYALSAVRYLNFENMETIFKEIKLNSAFTAKLNHSFRRQPIQKYTSTDDVNMYLLTENLQFQAFKENSGDVNFETAKECDSTDPPCDEQNLDTGILIGMAIAVAISGTVGVGIGFYLCQKYRQGIQ